MEPPEVLPIVYRGELAAAVSRDRIHILAPWLLDRPVGDAELRFVAMMCACAGQILNGAAPGPYSDAVAEEWARAALIDEEALASVISLCSSEAATALGVPPAQLRAARAERTLNADL